MLDALTDRRYLVPFKASRLPQQFTDVLIIGGGVAGLRAAIAASESANVLLLTKDTIDQSNTWYAQGGIAAVLQPLDSIESHVNDTKIGERGFAMTGWSGLPWKRGRSACWNCWNGGRILISRQGIRMIWRSRAK